MNWYEILIDGPSFGERDFNQCILWLLGYCLPVVWIMIWNNLRVGYCLKEILLRKESRKLWIHIIGETLIWTVVFGVIRIIPYMIQKGIDELTILKLLGFIINNVCIVMVGLTFEWLWSKKISFCIFTFASIASTIMISFGVPFCKALIWNLGMGEIITNYTMPFNAIMLLGQIIIIIMGLLYCRKLTFHLLEKTEE